MTSLPSSQIISKTAGACLTQITSNFNILVSIRNICSSFLFCRHSNVYLGVFFTNCTCMIHLGFQTAFFVRLFCYSIIYPLSPIAFDDFLKALSKKIGHSLQSLSVETCPLFFSHIISHCIFASGLSLSTS